MQRRFEVSSVGNPSTKTCGRSSKPPGTGTASTRMATPEKGQGARGEGQEREKTEMQEGARGEGRGARERKDRNARRGKGRGAREDREKTEFTLSLSVFSRPLPLAPFPPSSEAPCPFFRSPSPLLNLRAHDQLFPGFPQNRLKSTLQVVDKPIRGNCQMVGTSKSDTRGLLERITAFRQRLESVPALIP